MPSNQMTRRHLVQGASWSVPVILGTSMVPSYAASQTCANGTFVAPAPAADSDQAVTTTWTVPEGVSKICFSVLGGGGGRSYLSYMQGGAGGIITGELMVTPGQQLTLVVAAGGIGSPGLPATGGGGYGDGGSVLAPETETINGGLNSYAASGGGGSAILLGAGGSATPLVVAGGGGGGGFAGWWTLREPGITPRQWTVGSRPSAGGAGQSVGLNSVYMSIERVTATTYGGGGATGGKGGAGGANGTMTNQIDSVQILEFAQLPGNPGQDGFKAKGADGNISYIHNSGYTNAMRSGAGGGGYGGGGSGGIVGAASISEQSKSTGQVGASGGGGGNYVSSQVLGATIALGSNGGTARSVRNHGAISILY